MIQCWDMAPENRPTFKDLYFSVSKYIECIAGYLDIGFNPFTGGCGGEAEGKYDGEGKKEEIEEEEDSEHNVVKGEEGKNEGEEVGEKEGESTVSEVTSETDCTHYES